MKKTLLLASVVFTTLVAQSQLVISEIMYNPPESGVDSLEYIEIYNSSSSAINLSTYELHVATSVTTFPSVSISAGEYKVFSNNASAFQNQYGLAPIEVLFSGVGNGGATIKIKSLAGALIDSVTYDDVLPWDTLADGFGNSIELCDLAADNTDGTKWKASTAMIQGLVIAGKQMYGTPGVANSQNCSGSSANITEAQIKNIVLYPNPVIAGNDVILSENISGVVLDITGKQVASISNSNRISTQDFSKGVYFLRTSNFSQRFIVK